MLFKEIIAIYTKNYTKPTNKNSVLLIINTDFT
jgi:hypothetical protein